MSGDLAIDQKAVDELLISYLRGRGFTGAAESFKKEASVGDMVEDMTLSSHTSLLHRIMAYNRKESSPEHYTRSYQKLQNWMENSIGIYKYDMNRVMWPLLVHVFLDLIKKNFVHQAHKLMESNIRYFKRQHVQEISALQTITKIEDIPMNNVAKLFLDKKTRIEMSQFSHQMLFSFLEESSMMLLLGLINEHIQISITTRGPLTRKAIEGISKASKGQMETEAGVNETKFKFWGVLPADQQLHSLALDQGFGGLSNTLSSKASGSWGAGSELVSPEPMQKTSIPLPEQEERERQMRLQDLKARVRLGTGAQGQGALPSICLYTFLNAEATTSVCVSKDAALVSAGFTDSTVRTWNLRKSDSVAQEFYLGKSAISKPSSSSNKGKEESWWQTGGARPKLVRRKINGKMSGSLGVAGARDQEIEGAWPPYSKLVGHHGPVFSLSFSSEGEFLLSASQDSTVRLWNVETAMGLACYKGHTLPVWDASFSPVGYYFATASLDTTARLWSTHRGHPLRIFAGHRSDVQCVRFHPNSNVVATGSLDCTVRLWDVQSGDAARLFRGHTGGVRAVAVAPNGRLAASGGADGNVILWDLPEGKMIKSFKGHSKDILTLSFSDDGGTLASGSQDCSVCIWNVRSSAGDSTAPLKRFFTKNTPVSFLRFTPRNLLLASGVYRIDADSVNKTGGGSGKGGNGNNNGIFPNS